MKIKLLVSLLLIPLFAISQSKPFYKQTIAAYELNKKDTVNKKILVTYLDSLRNIISTENNISNAISGHKSKKEKTHSVVAINTDRLCVSAEIDEKGDTINKLIYVYDEKKNGIAKYQIRNGDTINGQKRVYDEYGRNTQLYDREMEGGKYFLSAEWEYDSNGNMTQCKTYNKFNTLVGLDKFENVYKKTKKVIITKFSYSNGIGFVKKYKKVKENNRTTTYYYSTRVGYNYGIKIPHIDGGMVIEEYDENGNMKELKIFDDKKNLIAHVKKTEVKLEPQK